MRNKWRNRVSGDLSENPEELPLLGLWQCEGGSRFWAGPDSEVPPGTVEHEPPETVAESLRSLGRRLQPLIGKPWKDWASVVPLDPTIADDLEIQPAEEYLARAMPHLESLSHNPRSHLTVEEVREHVGKARKVSHRAVSTLAAHSEDWHSRTFLAVHPRRILAELRQDQWDIYENRAVATLRKRILGALHRRLERLREILKAFDEANEHSNGVLGTRFRQQMLYQLWGEAFTKQPSRERLSDLIEDLDRMRLRLLSLAESFLFNNLPPGQPVSSPLLATNAFQCDPHYRWVFSLWHEWERVTSLSPLTMAERAERRRQTCEDLDVFSWLLAIRACKQSGLEPENTSQEIVAPGKEVRLPRNWSLVIGADRSLMLRHRQKPSLRICTVCTDLRCRPEAVLRKAISQWSNLSKEAFPTLILSLKAPDIPQCGWPDDLRREFEFMQWGSLFCRRVALIEASPLRLDCTENMARSIRWALAETEWPRLPLSCETPNWRDVWPSLGLEVAVSDPESGLRLWRPPPSSVVNSARIRASQNGQKLYELGKAREKLREAEIKARGDHRRIAEINQDKKALVSEEAKTKKAAETLAALAAFLKSSSDSFELLSECPCCKAKGHCGSDGILKCSSCGSEWGRRTCMSCHNKFAFVLPSLNAPSPMTVTQRNPLILFGADLCAPVIPSHNGFEVCCPFCTSFS